MVFFSGELVVVTGLSGELVVAEMENVNFATYAESFGSNGHRKHWANCKSSVSIFDSFHWTENLGHRSNSIFVVGDCFFDLIVDPYCLLESFCMNYTIMIININIKFWLVMKDWWLE